MNGTLSGPHTVNIIDSNFDTDSIIDRVMWVLIIHQYEKTILMTDKKIGYRVFSIYLLIIILTMWGRYWQFVSIFSQQLWVTKVEIPVLVDKQDIQILHYFIDQYKQYYRNVTASLSFAEILSLMLVFILVINGATILKVDYNYQCSFGNNKVLWIWKLHFFYNI